MAGKLQRYRAALAACFGSDAAPHTMKNILDCIDQNPENSDFSISNLKVEVHKACVNVPSAYKSRAPKILFYIQANHTYRLATEEEKADGLLQHGQLRQKETEEEIGEAFDPAAESTFAVEADLQRYLVRNLGILEKGLGLYDEKQPTEYRVAHREIDILAKDLMGVPVIVELKVARGLYPVLGQVLHYRALLKSHLKVPRVRAIIVASEITDDLRVSACEVGDISLFEYTLSMQVSKVDEVK